MAAIYKTFHTLRIALMAFALAFFTIGFGATTQASDIYTIENVTVDVKAENALTAREKAFEAAQTKAFRELSARMVAEGQAQSVDTPPVATIGMMIKDYEVSNEKLSSKRYIGTYKFRFEPRGVKRYFGQSGAQYSDVQSKPILILPFYDTGNGTILWSDANPWMRAWRSAPNTRGGLVPLITPLGDLGDVSDIGDNDALTYQPRNLNAMLARYNATEAVIAIAKPEGTALNIQLYRTDRVRPEYVHQILERALPGQSGSALYTRAVQSVKEALRKDWKQKTVVSAQQGGKITTRITFSSLQEWSNYQRKLARVQGVSNVALKALSPRDAYVDLSYEGTLDRLKVALEQADLYLGDPQFQKASTGGTSRGLNADYSQGMLGGTNQGAQKKIYTLSTTRPRVNNQSGAYPGGYQSPYTNPPAQSNYQTQF